MRPAPGAATIRLLGPVTESVTIPAGANVTLDLNGQTLTGATTDAIYVTTGATLEITGAGTVQAAAGGYAAVFNNGTTTLSGGTYTRSGGQWYTLLNHGTMTINSGVTVSTMSDGVSSLVENGYYSYTGANERNNYVSGVNSAVPTLTINGGSFNTAGYNAVKNDEGGVLNIYEGNFTSQRADGGVIMNWNQVAIYGGTFTATSENTAVISNGTWGSHAAGQAKIEGGNFIVAEGSNAKIFGYGEGSGSGGSMTVSNASFDGDFGADTSDFYTIDIAGCTSTEPGTVLHDGGRQGTDRTHHRGRHYILCRRRGRAPGCGEERCQRRRH